jgi:hypothetical protein
MQGTLFTHAFLFEGICDTIAWRSTTDEEIARFASLVDRALSIFPPDASPNEAVTESEVILPVLGALGFHDVLPRQTASPLDIPDFILFPDAEAKRRALAEPREERHYLHGITIVESKRWQRPLDRGDPSDALDYGAPSTQMLRYLSQVEIASQGRIRWGILTNGRHWRIYWQGAKCRSSDFFELDLPALRRIRGIQADRDAPEIEHSEHLLKVFYLMFRREAFVKDASGRTFHDYALDEGRFWEERVSQDLGRVVFERVFPMLVNAIVASDPSPPAIRDPVYLREVRDSALTLLYRLLFLLYAEDRNLIPVRATRYARYSLRLMREEVARQVDAKEPFSAKLTSMSFQLRELFNAIDEGDASVGLPPYNGGLFSSSFHPLLERLLLPDAVVAEILDDLGRIQEGDRKKWITYHDLSVQHLGSIYERLLDYVVVEGKDGKVILQLDTFARRTTGSYYTHENLVRTLVERTLRPLISERIEAFKTRARELAQDRRPRAERLRELQALDPALRILDLRVCDPAMGSGHFLVAVVDYLADVVLEQVASSPSYVTWTSASKPYRSPLADRLQELRSRILANASQTNWTIDPARLDDRHLVRRMILKRVVYGVDKNPMAVELAQLAVWLHTFTVGAPLSFLKHHLRTGDSLFGEFLGSVRDELALRGTLLPENALAGLTSAAKTVTAICELSDADLSEVRQSENLFNVAEQALTPIRSFLDFWHALRWIAPVPPPKRNNHNNSHLGASAILDRYFGDPFSVVTKGLPPVSQEESNDLRKARQEASDILERTRALAERERFFHFEVMFPGVWQNHGSCDPEGGFDAVISNPPWNRMKLQEVEWFAVRLPEIAHAQTAAERKRRIEELKKNNDPIWDAYLEAKKQAEDAMEVARRCGQYPLLSQGDINLYRLFVERAMRLVAPRGVVGLVVPSGIASDQEASAFFRFVTTTGRLSALLDFENKKVFFPDVDSRFKFCLLVFGGKERLFEGTDCAFFLHDPNESSDPERCFTLGPNDFALFNPNTRTAPVFRTRRDAEITRRIYERQAVFTDRRVEPPRPLWQVRYLTMFHMTNDSALFKTASQLDQDGFYPVAGRHWRKGSKEFVPLYEGKMTQAYDHRAASVEAHTDRLFRPGQPVPATLAQHQNPKWLPIPQFYVDREAIPDLGVGYVLCFKEITAPTNRRTVIACIAPAVAFSNNLGILAPLGGDKEARLYIKVVPLLLANLNAMVLDYVARQKVHGQTFNLFVLEQFPFVPPERFEEEIGGIKVGDFVRREVLHLTYTSYDLEPFARDLGYEGPPFLWDEEDRIHRMARLDALFFYLYGLEREDVAYILDTFPIVKREDERRFGRYRTRDLVLAYMNAVRAGDLDTVVDRLV